MIKRFLSSILIIFLGSISSFSYANVKVNKENLNQALERCFDSGISTCDKILVEEDVIKFVIDDITYSVKYKLDEQLTFKLQIPIEKGMNYDYFNKLMNNYSIPFYSIYAAIANIYGTSIMDGYTYFWWDINDDFSFSFSLSDYEGYIIVDDLIPGVQVSVTTGDSSNVIYTSEFGDRVIEYVDYTYKDYIKSDSDEMNSYVFEFANKNFSETSSEIICTLLINPDADFSQLNENSNVLEDLFTDRDITKENADYVVELRVGEKYKIETSEKISGYNLYGEAEVEFNNGYTEITAITPGTKSGDLFVGDTEKTIYIIIKEADVQRFSDVPTDLWSYQAIESLAQSGLVAGVGEGRFSPERGMKISEFCQVLANATGLESGADSTGYWAAKAIKSCIDKGYIYSHGDINAKNYDEVITREEAIAAMQLASGRTKLADKNITINDIPDGMQISDKYKDLVVQAYNSGITTGVNEQLKFSPKNKLTRAQVCQLFYNVDWTTKIENKVSTSEVIDEEELKKIDYEQLLSYELEDMTIKIVQTAAKPHYLMVQVGVYVADEEMLTRVTSLDSKIKDVVLEVFEKKTAEELEGNRESMKQAILDSIREIFVKQADKEKIVDVSITKYMIAQ